MSEHNTKYNQEEESGMIRAARRHPDHFAPLYNRYYSVIFLFIFKRIRDKEQSADLTAQVFLKALLNIKKYEDRGHPFSAWLYRIALNEVNQFFRSSKKHPEIEIQERDIYPLIDDIDKVALEKNIEHILSCLSELTQENQYLIQLRYFDHLSFKEIGTILAITEDNAKVRLYRAIDKLKELVGKKLE